MFGAVSAPSEPVALKMPANGAAIPPNDSQGVWLGASSCCNAAVAWAALAAGKLAPSS
jgi:hypothetical protein